MDEGRLAPAAVYAALRRRAIQGLVAGVAAGILTVIAIAVLDQMSAVAAWAGLGLLLTVASCVFGFGSLGLSWAASRRLNAFQVGRLKRSQRIRKAILRGRTGSLDEEEYEFAQEWSAIAEPTFLLQLVNQAPILVLVPGVQSVMLFLEPDDTFRRWYVAAMVVVLIPLEVWVVRQWLIVRAFARSSTSGA